MQHNGDSRQYIDGLKKRVGKQPFIDRGAPASGKGPCPIHGGDSGFDYFQRGGIWYGSCHSGCGKHWDAIQFVMEKDGVDFKTAVARLGGRVGKTTATTVEEKPKAKAITDAEWNTWGHEITDEDRALFASHRKDTTASTETWKGLGCRVKDGAIAFPYRLTIQNGEKKYYTVKARPFDNKDGIRHEHCVNSRALFNLDTVSCLDPVFVVEGEPDVAIMEENGFHAVGLMNAQHVKFEKAHIEILCEAPTIFLMADQKQRGVSDPGDTCMDALEKLLPPGKVHRISFSDAKDACELARIYGGQFTDKIRDLAEDAKAPWISKNIPDVTRILNLPDPYWIVDRMIPYKGVTIVCSPQGGQKTTLALALCRTIRNPIAHDFKFLGRDIMPHARQEVSDGFFVGAPDLPVLYIDRENPPVVIGSRLRRMGLLGDKEFRYWGDGDPHADTPEVNDPRLEAWMEQTGGVIVFDSLQDWYGDAKEIDNSAMVKIMHGFRRLARLGGGVIVLHHVAKPSGNKRAAESELSIRDMKNLYRGGTGIVSIPDMAIGVVKDEEAQRLILGEIRFRMCPEWQITANLQWDVEGLGRNDWIQLSVEEDLTAKEMHEKRHGKREEKRATKESQKKAELDTESARLEELVLEDRNASVRALEKDSEKSGAKIGRKRIPDLLELKGWKQSKAGEWVKTEAESILGAMARGASEGEF